MADGKTININFPFRNSPKGFFLDLTETDDQAIRSDLLHLILTQKGQRLYNPNFGTNLIKFIFEPNDNLTLSSIKTEINETLTKYLPNLSVNEISVTQSELNEYTATIRIDYTITRDVFNITDFVIINI